MTSETSTGRLLLTAEQQKRLEVIEWIDDPSNSSELEWLRALSLIRRMCRQQRVLFLKVTLSDARVLEKVQRLLRAEGAQDSLALNPSAATVGFRTSELSQELQYALSRVREKYLLSPCVTGSKQAPHPLPEEKQQGQASDLNSPPRNVAVKVPIAAKTTKEGHHGGI